MASVTDILEELGRSAARAHEMTGALYGGLAQNLGAIPGQVIQARTQAADQAQQRALVNQRLQAGALQIAGAQREQAEQSALDRIYGSGVIRDDGTLDRQKAAAIAQEAGMGHLLPHINSQADQWDASAAKLQEAKTKAQEAVFTLDTVKRDHLGVDAATLDPNDLGTFQLFVAKKAKDGSLDADTANRLIQSVQTPDQVQRQIAQWTGQSPTLQKQRAAGVEEGLKKAQTEKETAEAAKLRTEAAQGPKLGTPEEQYLKALTSGDQASAQRILTAIRMTADAKADPAQRKLAQELAGLRIDEARARLKKLTQDPGVQADTRTTATGRTWVDLSKYKGKEYTAAQQQAHAQGVYGASKEEADALQNIDVARQNMALIAAHLDKLPTSAGTRVLVGPANKLQAYLQTDEDLAAWGTWRTAAIQAMRALAGSKGLRINRSEIEASMENDIPRITDTLGTAKEKLTRVQQMLTSQETGIMGTAATSGGGTPKAVYYDANGNPMTR